MIVKQQLVGYEGSNISNIENILKAEKKRDHTRRKLRIEEISQETEIKASEEKELESTDRFELSREVNETIKQEVKLKTGLVAAYELSVLGNKVEMSTSLEGSISRTKEEAVKTTSKYAQDIT